MNLTYLIARYNINYQKAYEYYLISCYMNKNEILENHKDTYLTSITQALLEYDKSLFQKVKYNEIEKKITIHFNDSQKLFITTYKQYLLFEYDNKKYIVKDCHVFLELLRIFKKFLKEPIDNIN